MRYLKNGGRRKATQVFVPVLIVDEDPLEQSSSFSRLYGTVGYAFLRVKVLL